MITGIRTEFQLVYWFESAKPGQFKWEPYICYTCTRARDKMKFSAKGTHTCIFTSLSLTDENYTRVFVHAKIMHWSSSICECLLLLACSDRSSGEMTECTFVFCKYSTAFISRTPFNSSGAGTGERTQQVVFLIWISFLCESAQLPALIFLLETCDAPSTICTF